MGSGDDGGRGRGRGRGNFNPPADLFERRDQTKYRIEHEMRALEKRMNQTTLDNAAKQAAEKEREKCFYENIAQGFAGSSTGSRMLEAGERERARLVAEERNRLKSRGELNIPTRERFFPSIEERKKTMLWQGWNDQQKRRSLEMDKRASEERDKELGPSYNLSPELLRMRLPRTRSPEIRRKREN